MYWAATDTPVPAKTGMTNAPIQMMGIREPMVPAISSERRAKNHMSTSTTTLWVTFCR